MGSTYIIPKKKKKKKSYLFGVGEREDEENQEDKVEKDEAWLDQKRDRSTHRFGLLLCVTVFLSLSLSFESIIISKAFVSFHEWRK